jgi:outer membrane protein TolC
MKNIISILLCLITVIAFPIPASAATLLKYGMTLDELYRLADQNEDLSAITELNIQKENYEYQKKNIESQIRTINIQLSLTLTSDYNTIKLQIYNLEKQLSEIEFELSLFDKNKLEKQTRFTLKSEILSAYINLYYLNQQLAQSKANADYYKFNSESQATLYKNGKVTKNAAAIAEAQFVSAQNAVTTAERRIGFAEKNIALLLSCYDEKYYSFSKDKPENPTEFTLSEDKLIETFLKENADILRLENKIKIENEYLEKCKLYWSDESNSFKLQQNVIKQYEMQLEQLKQQYSLAVSQAYSEYISAREAYLSSLSYISTLTESRRINQVLFDEGEISKLEYMKNDLDYSVEIISAEKSYLNLIVAVRGLEGVEMGVLKE